MRSKIRLSSEAQELNNFIEMIIRERSVLKSMLRDHEEDPHNGEINRSLARQTSLISYYNAKYEGLRISHYLHQ